MLKILTKIFKWGHLSYKKENFMLDLYYEVLKK